MDIPIIDNFINNLTGNDLKKKKILLNFIKYTLQSRQPSEALINVIKTEIMNNKNFNFKTVYNLVIKALNTYEDKYKNKNEFVFNESDNNTFILDENKINSDRNKKKNIYSEKINQKINNIQNTKNKIDKLFKLLTGIKNNNNFLKKYTFIIIFFTKNFSKFNMNLKKKFLGQDMRILRDYYKKYSSTYIISKYKFKNKINFESIIIPKLTKILNNKKNIIRIRINEDNITYSKMETNKLVNLSIQKVDEINNEEILLNTINYGLQLKFFYSDDFVICCYNHVLFDGLSIMKMLNNFFDHDISNMKIKTIKYVPIKTELSVISSIPSLTKLILQKNHFNKNIHSIIPPTINFNKDLNEIKNFKNRLSTDKNKINFNSCIISMVCKSIFKASNKNKIQIGLIVGFNSKKRFNNYGFIIFSLNRNIIDKSNEEVCKIVDLNIKKNINMAYATYILTNIYDKFNNINRNVDILFSGLTLNNPSINNVQLDSVNIINPNPNIPMYCNYIGFDNTLSLNISINTPELNKEIFNDEIFKINKEFV